MTTRRIEQLAEALARRDRDLGPRIARVAEELGALQARAEQSVAAFRHTVARRGAGHLAHVQVDAIVPDEKHVDCMQFKVRRGRWEIACVGRPRGTLLLVGPYRTGKPERPCQEHPLPSDGAEAALDDLLLQLLCEASRV